MDPESTLYLKELTEDWANINLVIQSSFELVKNWYYLTNRQQFNMGTNEMQQQATNKLASGHAKEVLSTQPKSNNLCQQTRKSTSKSSTRTKVLSHDTSNFSLFFVGIIVPFVLVKLWNVDTWFCWHKLFGCGWFNKTPLWSRIHKGVHFLLVVASHFYP